MALAGYEKNLTLKLKSLMEYLFIDGKSPEAKEDFVHKGIATRSFKRVLQLSEHVECTGAKLEDGMLKVDLNYDPPEDKKAKKITVK